MTQTFKIEHGDVVLDERNGQTVMVSDTVKLNQDVACALSTEQRRDNIGAGLDSLIGAAFDAFGLRIEITKRLRGAIETMISLQRRFHYGQRSHAERVRALVSVTVSPVNGSSTDFAFRVDVVSDANSTNSVTGVLR